MFGARKGVVVVAQNEQETPPLTFGVREGVVVVVVAQNEQETPPSCVWSKGGGGGGGGCPE